jgi:peroxiredoxin Q/BCP
MAQLRQGYDEYVQREAEIVVLGPEGPRDFKRYWEKNDIPFIGIPDPKHTVLKLYGQEVKLFKFGRMPAQLLIDKGGRVRFVHYGHSMGDIPSNSEIWETLDTLNGESG